ncbi:MAG: condensation domain-containing protein, partial [Acidobacteria bacterium]|nr:condensation domain-containing protein [Acidobacteriota bacterium]
MKPIRNLDQLAIAANAQIKEKEYWLNQFAGPINKSSFPYDHFNPVTGNESRFTDEVFTIDADLYDRLMKLSRGSDYALHILLSSAVVILLARYTGETAITIGSPIYKPGKDGYLLNTVLPLKIYLPGGNTFKDLLIAVREKVSGATENQNYPIEILLEQLNFPPTGNDFPLFDVAVILENIHEPGHILYLPINIFFTFHRTSNGITGKLTYNSNLYEAAAIKRLTVHFINYFRAAVTAPDRQINEIDLLPDREREQILVEFNRTQADYPTGTTIHQLFIRQAGKSPHLEAIINSDRSRNMTYGQLDTK